MINDKVHNSPLDSKHRRWGEELSYTVLLEDHRYASVQVK
jgi:hypothetical protein